MRSEIGSGQEAATMNLRIRNVARVVLVFGALADFFWLERSANAQRPAARVPTFEVDPFKVQQGRQIPPADCHSGKSAGSNDTENFDAPTQHLRSCVAAPECSHAGTALQVRCAVGFLILDVDSRFR